jgi:acylglycerol lipase
MLLAAIVLAGCGSAREQPMGLAIGSPRIAVAAVVAADGYRLPLSQWGPAEAPRAVVLALHGFNAYDQIWADAARFWGQFGIATFAYDQRGFGAADDQGIWPGAATMVADADAALRLLHDRYPGVPLYLAGESMGGAVAILAATEAAPPPIDGLILVSPAAWGRQTLPLVNRLALDLSVALIPERKFTGEDLNIRATDNIPAIVALAGDRRYIRATRVDAIAGLVDLMTEAADRAAALRVPTLVLYGENDEVLSGPSIRRLIARLPDDEDIVFASYSRGFHMLLIDLARRTVHRDIASWILSPDQPLPSAADARGAAVRQGLAAG